MKDLRHVPIVALVAFSAVVSAQGNPNLSGTWAIERGAAPGGGRGAGGISGIPIATTLVIKVSPDDVTMEGDTGSGQTIQTFVYTLDGTAHPIPGALGWETQARASWESGNFVVMTKRSMQGPTGTLGVEVKDVYSVAGDVLTIDRSLGRATQKLVYRKGAPR